MFSKEISRKRHVIERIMEEAIPSEWKGVEGKRLEWKDVHPLKKGEVIGERNFDGS
jgi:hypothetical protein